jgi:glycosyl transferase family 25
MLIDYSTFVITLDAGSDRFLRVRQRLERAGLGFESVPGLLADALPEDLRRYFISATETADVSLKRGEIGCHAAHIALSRHIVERDIKIALVLEDDADFGDDFGVILRSILAQAPPSWDIIRLSSPPKRAYVPLADVDQDHRLVRYSKIPNVTTGYLLSLAGARKLIRPGIRRQAVDEYLRRPWLHDLDTYGVVPAPVRQSGAASTIDAIQPRDRRQSRWHAIGRADLSNLQARCSIGIAALGWRNWVACLTINVADRILKRFIRTSVIHICAERLRAPGRGDRPLRRATLAAAAARLPLWAPRPR